MNTVSRATVLNTHLTIALMRLGERRRVFFRRPDSAIVPLDLPAIRNVAKEISGNVLAMSRVPAYDRLDSDGTEAALRRWIRAILAEEGVVEAEEGEAVTALLDAIFTASEAVMQEQP